MTRADDAPIYPLVGSIQNSAGLGFLGNQAAFAIANGLGARLVHAQSSFVNAHGTFPGRSSSVADPQQFRRDVGFALAQRPAVTIVGYLPRPQHVEIVAEHLRDYKGVVLLDPVIGDYRRGLYVTEETARAIRELLLPIAQIVTPNRFEAEVLAGTSGEGASEYGFLNRLFDAGPQSAIVTSFARDAERRRTTSLFSNGYAYCRVHAPYYSTAPSHGAGDAFAAAVATFVALGGSAFAATLLATTLCTRAVAAAGAYGGATVDPVAALAGWNPQGHQAEDQRAVRFCARSNVEIEQIALGSQDRARLQVATPPKERINYG